jgi:hypothetical protein
MPTVITLLGFLALPVLAAAPADLPPDTARASLADGVVELVASVPVRAFEAVEAARDGALTAEEVAAHEDALLAAAREALVLRSLGAEGRIEAEAVSLPAAGGAGAAASGRQLVVRRRVSWSAPPTQFELEAPYLARTRTTLHVSARRGLGEEEEMTFDPEFRDRPFFGKELSTGKLVVLGALTFLAVAGLLAWAWRRHRGRAT